jgi:hypothetical protein
LWTLVVAAHNRRTGATEAGGLDRRKFFNRVSGGLVLAIGLTAAFIGLGSTGFPSAILGGIAAAVLMGNAIKKQRFYRP